MLLNLGFLLLGALIGSLITRQYDQFKVRDTDAHLLKLAAKEVDAFQNGIVGWILGQDFIVHVAKFSNKNISAFLETRLALRLTQKITADFVHVSEWIEKTNMYLLPFADHEPTKFELEELSSCTVEALYTVKETWARIANALVYACSKRYLWFDLNPIEAELFRVRTPQEAGDIRKLLGGSACV